MENEKLLFSITETLSGQRLDKALAHCEDIGTRSRASKLIQQNRVFLNGEAVKASQITILQEVYEIHLPKKEPTDLQPLALKLDVMYEDKDILVVNKPSGLVVHPAAGHKQDTLVNALISHCSDLAMGFGENRPGIVHRLDMDTSGILVTAKNDRSFSQLAQQFKLRKVHRRYWAVVFGRLRIESGKIENHIGRHPQNRKKMAVLKSGGRLAITHFRVLSSNKGLSLLEIRLETGRTHQIRVHLANMGHPIVGDLIYGAKNRHQNLQPPLRDCIGGLNRFALHAYSLGFLHPTTGQELMFETNWPDNLINLVQIGGLGEQ